MTHTGRSGSSLFIRYSSTSHRNYRVIAPQGSEIQTLFRQATILSCQSGLSPLLAAEDHPKDATGSYCCSIATPLGDEREEDISVLPLDPRNLQNQ
jgi:hypothetical protein